MTTPSEYTRMRFEAALAALQGMLAGPTWGSSSEDAYAKGAVKYADALLAELDIKPEAEVVIQPVEHEHTIPDLPKAIALLTSQLPSPA